MSDVLRPSRSLLGLLLLLAVTIGQAPARGQDQLRVGVQLTQVPALSEIWPADFNGDGITDLVANRSDGFGSILGVVIQLGHGDGTFDTPQTVNVPASGVVGVGDLNRDGFVDIITSGSSTYVLPGRGDGSFSPALPLAISAGSPTYVVDMNSDGMPDLVTRSAAPVGIRVAVYPGHGDFTFGTPTVMSGGSLGGIPVLSLTIADFNGDGLLDVATNAGRIDVFVNQGNLTFIDTITPAALNGGLTARDVDSDGVVDLIAGSGHLTGNDLWTSGLVSIFHGNGDATFQAPVTYPVNNGPVMVVAGDFNGDGIQDIATGNRSVVESCDNVNQLWNSISILFGRGDGTFAPAQSFALGDSVTPDPGRVSRVNTSDLNADGRTDLLVSPGTILVMQPPGPNHPPIVSAGPDLYGPYDGYGSTLFNATASDPDHDWLSFAWRDDLGHVSEPVLRSCPGLFSYSGATRIFTLTADDGHGGVSADFLQWVFSSNALQPPPSGYSSAAIGDVSAGAAYGAFTVAASGADIWGTSDAFRYVYTSVSGNFDVSTQVTSLENIDPWTKAGLMIRQSLSASSQHAFVFATPTAVNGTAFQRRIVDGGESVHTAGPAVAPPVWLRLMRQGDTVTAFVRVTTTDPWTTVDTQTFSGLADPVYVGLAVTSHASDKVATARFGNYNLVPLTNSLPAGWENADVGSVAAAGSGFGGSGGNFTVGGSGADIWDTQDAFHFTFTRWAGDGKAVVHVADFDASDPWSKAGLMIRTSLDPSAAHHFLLLSGQNGSAYQRRPTAGATTLHTGIQGAWFLIQRSGGTLHLWYSNDGASPTRWEPLPDATFPTGEALIGLAVTSHADGQLATATFDHVSVTAGATPPALVGGDVGAVGIIGSDSFNDTAYTVSGSGADIWDTVDAFHYVNRELPSNGTIIARIASLNGVDPWSKAGVMIRAGSGASSPHAFMLLSDANGLAFQRRTTAGGITTHTGVAAGGAPQWVRLTRVDDVITAAYSSDGQTWIDVGQDTLPIGTGPARVGLAVTSHDNNALATAVFDHVLILP